ncbi:MAG: M24 family metallopeptidase [Halobacteriaceae archaeon]
MPNPDSHAPLDPDFSPLAAYCEEAGVDGYLLDADGEDSDQRYLSGFTAPDAFVTLFVDGEVSLLVSGLEYGRATAEARADDVERLSAHDYRELVAEHGRRGGRVRAVAAFLAARDVDAVAVPDAFPLGTADGLRDQGVDVRVETRGVVEEIRATKQPVEVEHVRTAQRANEDAMRAAEDLLAAAEPVPPADLADAVEGEPLGIQGKGEAAGDEAASGDGPVDGDAPVLVHDGAVLTSERVKEAIEVTLLREECGLDETIVACGADGAEPHNRGSGPLRAGEPVVVDIFPRDRSTGYHADMTRTFVVGEPTPAAREFYEVTREAQRAGLDAVAPGVTGDAVDAAVSAVYEDAGYPTLRSDDDAETGFIHGTGHGVGLDVHEAPRLAQGGEELRPGHVVTVEPGLYDPAVGGVRIEDLVVVTEDGCENLTAYPREFEV